MASIAEKILPWSKCYIDALNPTMMSPMRLINETENEMKPKSAWWLCATDKENNSY